MSPHESMLSTLPPTSRLLAPTAAVPPPLDARCVCNRAGPSPERTQACEHEAWVQGERRTVMAAAQRPTGQRTSSDGRRERARGRACAGKRARGIVHERKKRDIHKHAHARARSARRGGERSTCCHASPRRQRQQTHAGAKHAWAVAV